MDIYTINGVQIEYDTMDLVNMEIYDTEVKRIAAEAQEWEKIDLTADNYLGVLRRQCESVLDAFECILGEGATDKIFGGRMNVEAILNSYGEFTRAVAERVRGMGGAQMPEPNRETRRAAERAQRRADAAERVKIKRDAEPV